MQQLDRYLETIGLFLPRGQREDILKELAENILSKMEDEETKLGRPLDEAERAAVLNGYGNPMLVASRYRTDTGGLTFGRQLIGPALFPIYVKVLALNAAVAFAIVAALIVTLRLPASNTFFSFIGYALIQSAGVTLIFALVQRHVNQHPAQWELLNPKSSAAPGVKRGARVSRLESILQIVVLLIVVSLIQELLAAPTLTFAPFQFAPIWYQLYPPLMLIQFVGIARAVSRLLRPDRVQLHAAVQAGTEIANLIVLGILLAAGNWVVLVEPADNAMGTLLEILKYVNQYFFFGLLIAACVSFVQVLFDIRRSLRSWPVA